MHKPLPDIYRAPIHKGTKVILRSELNVPIENEKVVSDFRLSRARSTMEYLHQKGARVVLLGHRGKDGSKSLRPVYEYFKISLPMHFFEGAVADAAKEVEKLSPGEILLLENIRKNTGELTNDSEFSKTLASLGEVYINDSFSVSHRMHASIVGITKFLPSFAGIQFMKEVEELSKAFNPTHPALFILGGAKFETKVPLIKKYLNLYDKVFVGGALANDFFKAEHFETGHSLVSESHEAEELLKNPNLIVPVDVTVQTPAGVDAKYPKDVEKDEIIIDVGPETVLRLQHEIDSASFVLWNGPLGAYEEGFVEPTHALAQIIASSKVTSIVGGGDTIAAIAALNLEDRFSFLSTGGGAMLAYLESGTLPGIEALISSSK